MPILLTLLGSLMVFVGGILLGEGDAREKASFAYFGLILSLSGLAFSIVVMKLVLSQYFQ